MTVLESIQLSTDYLEKKGIESPRINAEMLLAHILSCKRLDLYLAFDKPLKEHEIIQYREFLKRRGSFEPLQYITGSVEFYGLPFKVNKNVLIPRPETEILVETVINKLDKSAGYSFLDIGTGSGIIPITLSRYFPSSSFTAIDKSKPALEVAEENAKINSAENITFVHADIKTDTIAQQFDIIVSNPPYVSLSEYKTLQHEITRYEPAEAVTDNNEGYDFYKLIIEKSDFMLKENGQLYFEVGKGQSEAISSMMSDNNFSDIEVVNDYQNIGRVVYGVKK